MTPEFRKICIDEGVWIERTLCFFFRTHKDHQMIDPDGFCYLCFKKVGKV